MLKSVISTDTSKTTILIRLMTGLVFLSEGIQKFLFPDTLGVGRFIKIGILYPEYLAPFVGGVEVTAGIMLLIGWYTRIAAFILLINICVAIFTTKIPMLHNSFWTFAHEVRTDLSMLTGTVFLCIKGGGAWSFDSKKKQHGKGKRKH